PIHSFGLLFYSNQGALFIMGDSIESAEHANHYEHCFPSYHSKLISNRVEFSRPSKQPFIVKSKQTPCSSKLAVWQTLTAPIKQRNLAKESRCAGKTINMTNNISR